MRKAAHVKSRSTITYRVAMGLAVLHLLAVLVFVVYLHQSNEGQAILLWTLWKPVDFPISLLVPRGLDVLPSTGDWAGSLRPALPYLVHGVLGTLWWFCVPFLIAWLFEKITGTGKKRPG
jgi:hypothetical protein